MYSSDTRSYFLAIWNFSSMLHRELFGTLKDHKISRLLVMGDKDSVQAPDMDSWTFHTHVSYGFSPPSAEDVCMLLAQCVKFPTEKQHVTVLAKEGIYTMHLSAELISKTVSIMQNGDTFAEKQQNLCQLRDEIHRATMYKDFSTYQKHTCRLGVIVEKCDYTSASP
jgi:hypothetical protein